MTPEERFARIETQIENLIVVSRAQNETLQKHNEGIQSLIVVARTVLTSIQELRTVQDKMIEEVRELHKHTDEKLNILVDTVDRIIRRDNGSKGGA